MSTKITEIYIIIRNSVRGAVHGAAVKMVWWFPAPWLCQPEERSLSWRPRCRKIGRANPHLLANRPTKFNKESMRNAIAAVCYVAGTMGTNQAAKNFDVSPPPIPFYAAEVKQLEKDAWRLHYEVFMTLYRLYILKHAMLLLKHFTYQYKNGCYGSNFGF